jgi:hypothetical protein
MKRGENVELEFIKRNSFELIKPFVAASVLQLMKGLGSRVMKPSDSISREFY